MWSLLWPPVTLAELIDFSWYLCNCMTSLYNIAFWFWLNAALCCPAPADFLMAPAVSRRPVCLHCISSLCPHLFFSPPPPVFCLSSASLVAALNLFSYAPFSLFLPTARPLLPSKPSGLCRLYTAPSHLLERSVLWFACVSVCPAL